MKNQSIDILSDITVHMKYAKYLPNSKRRETWEELCDRNMQMHIRKFPNLAEEIRQVYKDYVVTKKVLPSMRSMQFAGKPIELNNSRVFNCAYLPVDDWRAFGEIMFLLLGGTGVGFSVQNHHIEQLPEIKKPSEKRTRKFLISDSIEGWADAVKVLIKSYFYGTSTLRFIYDDIRPKGARLVTSGGKAPGPQPLKDCIHNLRKILDTKEEGSKLTSIEVHDMICHIADAVLAGGIRRAALISLFSADDDEMMSAKAGSWWELNPQRGRANNSAVFLRHKLTEDVFMSTWQKIEASGAGEPGIYLSNDKEWGTNPSLRKGTRVLTTDGIFPIEELQDKEFTVKNLNGELSKARCWLSGKNKQLWKIKLKGGHEYHATDVHEWPVLQPDGSYSKVKSENLTPGMRLPVIQESSLYNSDNGSYLDGLTIGWNLGDGWVTERDSKTQYGFIFSEKDIQSKVAEKIISHLNFISKDPKNQTKALENYSGEGNIEINLANKNLNNFFKSFGITHKSNGISNEIWSNTSDEFKKGLIDGLFSSDGHFSEKIILTSSHEKLIKDISELLGFYGVKTLISEYKIDNPTFPNGKQYEKTYTGYRLKVTTRSSVDHFRSIFSLSVGYKQEQLDSLYEGKKKHSSYHTNGTTIEIIGVEKTELYEDVWDISVYDETHCFQIGHSITGNCCEIALRPFQFCNLTEINASTIDSQSEFNGRAYAAAFLGTLQASYTDFHYLRPIWQRNTERDSLLGVSMTGIASMEVFKYNIEEAVEVVKATNKNIASVIGINPAARTTAVKPAGTTSLTLGTSSGIHAWHNDYYIRRIRVGKNEAIYTYLLINHPELLEDDITNSAQAIISIPQKAPDGAVTRKESAIELLERVKVISERWVKPGHIDGQNTHNVSATVTVKPGEWLPVGIWMWKNRDAYNGLSVLPYAEYTYKQLPFEDITEAEYNRLADQLHSIDLSQVVEMEDFTDLSGELACAGGACEVV